MNHLTVQELSASLDGVLTGPALEQVAAHLVTCHECRENQARLTKHDDALRRLLAHDPNDRFIDDLARRSEALVVAIVKGQPVPPLVTTMPLQAEEEPDDAHEPTSSGSGSSTTGSHAAADREAAGATSETGFGRIGMRPTGSTQAPGSDPEIARRMLEEIERGNTAAFEGLEIEQHVEPKASESGRFKPPGWAPSAPPQARESSLTRAVEKNRHEQTGTGPSPSTPDRAAPPTHTNLGDAREPASSSAHPEPEPEYPRAAPVPALPEPARTAPARGKRFGVAHAHQPAWERLGLEPDPFSPGVYRDPLTGASIEPPPLYARRPASNSSRRGGSTPGGHAAAKRLGPAIAALATVCGLVVLVLALRTSPAGAPGAGTNGGARFSLRLPRVEFVRKPAPGPSPASRGRTGTDVRDATTPLPVDRAVTSPTLATTGVDPLRVCGQVVDLTGKPLAGVLLTVDGSPAQVRSDGEGRFCLTAPAGPHVVRIQGNGTVPQRITLEFASAAPEFRVLLP